MMRYQSVFSGCGAAIRSLKTSGRTSGELLMRGFVILLIGAAAACQSIADADAPMPVPADYAAREQAMMRDGDQCGPQFIQSRLPKALVKAITPVTDGPFRPVCERHDACYRLGEQQQAWCDDRMRDEMLAICENGAAGAAYRLPGVGDALCRFHAGIYYTAINNTYGGYAYGGGPGGEITSQRTYVVNDWFSDDELTVCVEVYNPTPLMQEYDVELHHDDGRLIDREPDTHERNVRAGEMREFCVGTNFTPAWSISDLSDVVHVSVRADTPDSFAFTNDMVIVDTQTVEVR